jgi:hypothetical protein
MLPVPSCVHVYLSLSLSLSLSLCRIEPCG